MTMRLRLQEKKVRTAALLWHKRKFCCHRFYCISVFLTIVKINAVISFDKSYERSGFLATRLDRLQPIAELPALEMEGLGNGCKYYHKEGSDSKLKHPFILCYN
ncbi:hypothetical protein Y032_0126g1340 [Ancylostoma ceylanicum]|uniref:Uncharacterized protein n=1 Tax=Ancylostoma ceylanicum TaxID=53326 RepID=A0A016T7R2_9BILA|nr:hypothetical protein Y032_0126g1340 [Ancylostoma ceylanicum]